MDTATITWSLLFSSAGLGYFIYGRRQNHKLAFYSGIGLMVYPYFMGTTAALVTVGALLMAAPFVLKSYLP